MKNKNAKEENNQLEKQSSKYFLIIFLIFFKTITRRSPIMVSKFDAYRSTPKLIILNII